MAKAKAEVKLEKVEEQEVAFVEVEYAAGEFSTTFYGEGFRVEFVKGKAVVAGEVAKALKEAKLVK